MDSFNTKRLGPRTTKTVSFIGQSYQFVLLFNIVHVYLPNPHTPAITRRQKSSNLKITSLHSSPTHLLVGTSAGVVLTVTLPFIEPSLEPHTLSHPPTPTPLHHGHVDSVHFSLVLQKEGEPLAITGGSGHHNFNQSISQDTDSCLLLWRWQSAGSECKLKLYHLLVYHHSSLYYFNKKWFQWLPKKDTNKKWYAFTLLIMPIALWVLIPDQERSLKTGSLVCVKRNHSDGRSWW